MSTAAQRSTPQQSTVSIVVCAPPHSPSLYASGRRFAGECRGPPARGGGGGGGDDDDACAAGSSFTSSVDATARGSLLGAVGGSSATAAASFDAALGCRFGLRQLNIFRELADISRARSAP